MGAHRNKRGVGCPSCGSHIEVPWLAAMPRFADRQSYTCSACGSTYRVSFRNVVQAALGVLIGAVAGLPLWFVTLQALESASVGLGMLVGLAAVLVIGLLTGALAGRIMFRLVQVQGAGAESKAQKPVA